MMRVLSGYRVMWIMALFDLPVGTKRERKRATKFRQFLLDQGFEMAQFSVYVRFTRGREHVDTIMGKIGGAVLSSGKVDLICFTDKQYEAIVSFRGKSDADRPQKPEQLAIF